MFKMSDKMIWKSSDVPLSIMSVLFIANGLNVRSKKAVHTSVRRNAKREC